MLFSQPATITRSFESPLFAVCSRKGSGCASGVYGFKLAVAVEPNTHYCEPLGVLPVGEGVLARLSGGDSLRACSFRHLPLPAAPGFVATAVNATLPPAKFNMTAQLIF